MGIAKFFGTFAGAVVGVLIMISVMLGIGLFNSFSPIGDFAKERANAQAILIEKNKYSAYYGVMSGSNVTTAMRQFSLEPDFYIYVKTRNNLEYVGNPAKNSAVCQNFDFTSKTLLASTRTDCNVTVDMMEDEGSIYYVQPQARFVVGLVYNAADRVYGIHFNEK